MPEQTPPRPSGPNCYQCRHFAVSWDPRLPYSCKLMGFKSRALPAIEVLRADGLPCRGYAAKSGVPGSAPVAPAAPQVAPQRQAPHCAAPEPAPQPRLSTFRRWA